MVNEIQEDKLAFGKRHCSTLDKIAGSLEGTFAVSLDALTGHMSVQAEDRVVIDPAAWEAVARAIERLNIWRADYRRFDGKSGTYEIEPLHLLAYHGNWYVLARSRGSDKTFALSRFGKVAPTGKHFKRPAGFDWREFSREAFGIAHGEKPERIRLMFSARVGQVRSDDEFIFRKAERDLSRCERRFGLHQPGLAEGPGDL